MRHNFKIKMMANAGGLTLAGGGQIGISVMQPGREGGGR